MTIEVRTTVADDWPVLKSVRLAALLDTPAAFGVTHAEAAAYSDEQWRDRAGRTPSAYVLAFAAGDAAGTAAGVVDEQGLYKLMAMWVRPDCRGEGIADKLVDAVKALAQTQGHRRVALDVAPDNLPAVRFYQRQGFTFLPLFEPLASHPEIIVQRMEWCA